MLQNKNSDVSEAIFLIESVKGQFSLERENSDYFNKLYEAAVETANACDIDINEVNKRVRKVPKKLKNFVITQNLNLENIGPNSKESFKIQLYIPVIDIILSELNNRFSSHKDLFMGLTCFNPNFKDKFLIFKNIVAFAKHYNSDLELLQSELKILPSTIKKYEVENKIKIENIMQFVDMVEKYKLAFSETYKLTLISITIPVSSAACERSFSCLRRLKNYLRNTMTNEKLSTLAIINIEKQIAKNISLEEVVDVFAKKHPRRLLLEC